MLPDWAETGYLDFGAFDLANKLQMTSKLFYCIFDFLSLKWVLRTCSPHPFCSIYESVKLALSRVQHGQQSRGCHSLPVARGDLNIEITTLVSWFKALESWLLGLSFSWSRMPPMGTSLPQMEKKRHLNRPELRLSGMVMPLSTGRLCQNSGCN